MDNQRAQQQSNRVAQVVQPAPLNQRQTQVPIKIILYGQNVKFFIGILFNFVFIVYGILVVRKLSEKMFYFTLVLIDLLNSLANLILVFLINKFAKTVF